MNKGRESMVYLTYIIDYYDSLPLITTFLHAHRYAHHNEGPRHDNVWVMQHLQLSHVKEMGYVNLRCDWEPGCNNPQKHVTSDLWREVFKNTSTTNGQLLSITPL